MTVRTQDEILARFKDANDFLGFAREVLIETMTPETVLRYNPDASISDGWTEWSAEQIESNAREYLDFAVEKALAHRGLSAERSVIKLREFAWLLGRDDVVAAMDAAEYPQYGMPKVMAFAYGMNWKLSPVGDLDALNRMERGVECQPGCDEGCGQ